MSQMHELLAVESSVAGNYQRDLQETLKIFGRPDLFTQEVTSKEHFNAEDQRLDTTETKEMTTTVVDRLKWWKGSVVKYFDLLIQKDRTNQKSCADIVVGDYVIDTNVPATTLLALESKLNDIRSVIEATPTLQAGFNWVLDPNTNNVYKNTEEKVSFSTKRVTKPVVLYEATKEHPAQVKEVSEDIPVAKITKKISSGMLTSKQKANMLSRLDLLLQAVKRARQQANRTTVEDAKMGENIMNYLFGSDLT